MFNRTPIQVPEPLVSKARTNMEDGLQELQKEDAIVLGKEPADESQDTKAIDETAQEAEREKLRREREARAQALTLEIVGDLPYAEVKPPENVLFVCKLNPVTEGQYLHLSNKMQMNTKIFGV